MKMITPSDSLKTNPIRTQNKPNLRKAKMNINFYYTKDYENDNTFRLPENKPNTNPNKPNFKG